MPMPILVNTWSYASPHRQAVSKEMCKGVFLFLLTIACVGKKLGCDYGSRVDVGM